MERTRRHQPLQPFSTIVYAGFVLFVRQLLFRGFPSFKTHKEPPFCPFILGVPFQKETTHRPEAIDMWSAGCIAVELAEMMESYSAQDDESEGSISIFFFGGAWQPWEL